jgi:hypothetical protein
VTLSRRSSITDVAATVAAVLRESSFTAVLTGGACATIYSGGAYQSYDLDYVIQAGGRKRALDEAMARAGFARAGDRYEHPKVRFFVEFVRGPLAIGDDVAVRPTMLRVGRGRTLALSPTDACRDRLAAFYHWSDRQSLAAAIAIAARHRVNLAAIRRWSEREGATDRFGEFRDAILARTRRTPRAAAHSRRVKGTK